MAPPPRSYTNPTPRTESARAAMSNFFCELCNKGYARHNEFIAHQSSYEHTHNQRRLDLKAVNSAMAKKAAPAASSSGGNADLKPITIDLKKDGGGGGGSGEAGAKKKKKTFVAIKLGGGGNDDAGGGAEEESPADGEKPADTNTAEQDAFKKVAAEASEDGDGDGDSDDDALGYALYDPHKPTGCSPGCPGLAA